MTHEWWKSYIKKGSFQLSKGDNKIFIDDIEADAEVLIWLKCYNILATLPHSSHRCHEQWRGIILYLGHILKARNALTLIHQNLAIISLDSLFRLVKMSGVQCESIDWLILARLWLKRYARTSDVYGLRPQNYLCMFYECNKNSYLNSLYVWWVQCNNVWTCRTLQYPAAMILLPSHFWDCREQRRESCSSAIWWQPPVAKYCKIERDWWVNLHNTTRPCSHSLWQQQILATFPTPLTWTLNLF